MQSRTPDQNPNPQYDFSTVFHTLVQPTLTYNPVSIHFQALYTTFLNQQKSAILNSEIATTQIAEAKSKLDRLYESEKTLYASLNKNKKLLAEKTIEVDELKTTALESRNKHKHSLEEKETEISLLKKEVIDSQKNLVTTNVSFARLEEIIAHQEEEINRLRITSEQQLHHSTSNNKRRQTTAQKWGIVATSSGNLSEPTLKALIKKKEITSTSQTDTALYKNKEFFELPSGFTITIPDNLDNIPAGSETLVTKLLLENAVLAAALEQYAAKDNASETIMKEEPDSPPAKKSKRKGPESFFHSTPGRSLITDIITEETSLSLFPSPPISPSLNLNRIFSPSFASSTVSMISEEKSLRSPFKNYID